MQMTAPAPFFIFALPRSRTAWLSALLSSAGGGICHHDALAMEPSMAGLKALVAAGAAGFAETGGPFFFRSIHRAFPTARYVFIWRGAMDVARSLNRIGAHGDDFVPEGLAAMNAAHNFLSSRAPVLDISFGELDSMAVLQRLWQFTRGDAFDETRAREFCRFTILKTNPFAGKRGDALRRDELALQQGKPLPC